MTGTGQFLPFPVTGLNGNFIHRKDIHNLVVLFADPQETFVGRILGPRLSPPVGGAVELFSLR